MLRSTWIPLLVFVVLATVMRVFSFFPSVINHDESTYILIGEGLLRGHTYFVDLIDTKPIGIFALYAGMLAVAGKSIWVLRMLAAWWLGLTAFGLYRLALRGGGGPRTAWAAGALYLFLTSLWTYYGVSPNTELFFNGFTVLAMVMVWGREGWWRHLLAGLCLGIGFVIKYVVVFDGIALGIFVLWQAGQSGWLQASWKRVLPLVLGAAAPFGGLWLWYGQGGYASEFYFYTFTVMGNYPVEKVWWKSLLFVLDFFGRFFPVTLLAIWAWRWPTAGYRHFQQFLVLWLGVDLVAVLLTGKLFGHYFIQLMPALALLAAGVFATREGEPTQTLGVGGLLGAGVPPRLRWAGRMLVVGLALAPVLQYLAYYHRPDYVRETADYLRPRLQPGDKIYTGNTQQILYFLLNLESPTPYVHRSLLWDPHHAAALGVDLEDATQQILAQRPRYILLQASAPDNALSRAIYAQYQQVHTFSDGTRLWEYHPPH